MRQKPHSQQSATEQERFIHEHAKEDFSNQDSGYNIRMVKITTVQSLMPHRESHIIKPVFRNYLLSFSISQKEFA